MFQFFLQSAELIFLIWIVSGPIKLQLSFMKFLFETHVQSEKKFHFWYFLLIGVSNQKTVPYLDCSRVQSNFSFLLWNFCSKVMSNWKKMFHFWYFLLIVVSNQITFF